MQDFIKTMAEILEVGPEELDADTDFRQCTEFDSLMGFAMICEMDDVYGVEVSVNQFLECKTLGDLFALTQQ